MVCCTGSVTNKSLKIKQINHSIGGALQGNYPKNLEWPWMFHSCNGIPWFHVVLLRCDIFMRLKIKLVISSDGSPFKIPKHSRLVNWARRLKALPLILKVVLLWVWGCVHQIIRFCLSENDTIRLSNKLNTTTTPRGRWGLHLPEDEWRYTVKDPYWFVPEED